MAPRHRNGGDIPLSGRDVSDDPAMEKIIAAQAKVNELRRENRALRRDRDEMLEEFTDLRNARPVPTSPSPAQGRNKAEKVRVYAGDLHGMRRDTKAVAAFLSDLKTLDPDEIFFGGDMLECGGFLAKHQPVGYVAYCDYTYQEDVNATADTYDAVQKAAPNASVEVLEGNHDQRPERWIVDQVAANQREAGFLQSIFGPETLLRYAERNWQYHKRSVISEDGLTRGWIKRGKMLLVHELKDGDVAARRGLLKTAANVTYFHSHRFDQSATVYPTHGLVTAFSPGCLCEMQPMWKHSDPSGWNQGYDVEFITKSGEFLRVHVPIWRGKSLAGAMIERFKS